VLAHLQAERLGLVGKQKGEEVGVVGEFLFLDEFYLLLARAGFAAAEEEAGEEDDDEEQWD
jgi:hypothetical protein